MLFDVIFLYSITIVTATNITYTKESFTRDREPCMTDCINNLCVFGFAKKNGICDPGSTPGLQYYTALDKTQHKLCKSRCGKFDNSTDDWCYVSDDEWDYCNPEMGIDVVQHKQFTETSGPCKDECRYNDAMTYPWCHTYWSSWSIWSGWDSCFFEGFTYMQTKTRQGLDCVGICGAHDKKKYNWCMSTEQQERSCAPIARNLTIFNNMFDRVSILEKKNSCHIEAGPQRKIPVFYQHDSVPSGFVSGNTKLLEYPNNGLLTESFSEDGNVITSYTIMPYSVKGDPALPIVVRARVSPENLRPFASRQGKIIPFRVRENLQRLGMYVDDKPYQNDVDGHIINYRLGGPGKVYNFAAQTQRPKGETSSVWYETENFIRDFIERTKGWAEITVLVIYSNILQSWKPDGYAVDFALYNHDNTLYRECNDYFYSNYLENN